MMTVQFKNVQIGQLFSDPVSRKDWIKVSDNYAKHSFSLEMFNWDEVVEIKQ